MKYFLTFFILLSFVQITNAQLSFKIEELSLSNYNIELKDNVIDEDLENGPYVWIKCAISNNTDDVITLMPERSIIAIVFGYHKQSYTIEVVPLPFVDNETLQILPDKAVTLEFGSNLLLGSDIYNSKKGDYTKEMLAILPTLKIIYNDKTNKLQTDEIKSVVIK